MIEYRWTRLEPLIDPVTGEVDAWVIGLVAESEGISAWRDETVTVPERKPLAQWTQTEIIALAEETARTRPVVASPGPEEGQPVEGRDWYEALADQLANQRLARIAGPNFAPDVPQPVDPAIVDMQTGMEITNQMHPHAGLDEQIGILRAQIVAMLNTFGLPAIPEFARFNEVAIRAIEAARAKKGV